MKAMDDDAIHIAAPWETRSSLCGQWNRRNLATLGEARPDGGSGCWTCLMAAGWIDKAEQRARAAYRFARHQAGLCSEEEA